MTVSPWQWFSIAIANLFALSFDNLFCYWKSEFYLDTNSLNARHLLVKLFESLSCLGYFVDTALDLSRKVLNKSVLFFKKGRPNPTRYFCLAPIGSEKLFLLDAPAQAVKVSDQASK